MADFADALAALISAIGLHRPAVIGLSFGAAVTIELERRHPGLAHSLVLVGAYAGWAGSLPHEVVVARRRAALAEAALPSDEWVVVARRYLPGFFATDVSPELADETLALMADARPAGTRAFVEAMAEADLRAGLERIRSPVLLVYGELDQRSPLAVATDLAARIPTSRLTVIPGVGHLCNLEAPEAFNEAVRVFLSGDAMPSP
jgi:pimeloyl-ACP methyl ester carboxylesterase